MFNPYKMVKLAKKKQAERRVFRLKFILESNWENRQRKRKTAKYDTRQLIQNENKERQLSIILRSIDKRVNAIVR